jgi:NAD(P)-dependent dehydrogenase (short-subunit alcohol dehydrogenase family)
VIVTGASGGIGKAVASRLARLGYAVLLVGRSEARVTLAVDEVGSAAGGDVSGFVGDVAEEQTAEAYAQACIDRYGGIDAFVNGAALEGPVGPFETCSPQEFDRLVAVNVRGAFLGLRTVIPVMKRAGGGRVVNVASQAGLRGVSGCAAYSASKHAVIGLSQSVALEVAGDGIAVNAVCPGPTATEMIARVEGAISEAGGDPASIAAGIPNGRYGEPDEVAQLIAWLLSDAPTHLTGAVLPVDGGMTAG